MAKFNATGIDGLQLSIEEFSKLPDDVVDKILETGGRVVVAEQKRTAGALGLRKHGTFIDSIRMFPKVGGKDNKRYVLVYPYGAHHKYNRRVVTKEYARSKHGRTYTVGGGVATATNNDLGFVFEFGGHGNDAKNWMQNANTRSANAMTDAMAEEYDKWLKSIGL